MFYKKKIDKKEKTIKKEYLSLSNLKDNNYYSSIDLNVKELRKKREYWLLMMKISLQ